MFINANPARRHHREPIIIVRVLQEWFLFICLEGIELIPSLQNKRCAVQIKTKFGLLLGNSTTYFSLNYVESCISVGLVDFERLLFTPNRVGDEWKRRQGAFVVPATGS